MNAHPWTLALSTVAVTWMSGCQCANMDLIELDSDMSTSTSTSTSTSSPTATSTSTASSTSAGTSDDATSSLFLFPPDGGGGGVCVVAGGGNWHCSYCDLFAQDCLAGDKCMPWAYDGGNTWNSARCSPIAEDPGQPGDACTVEGSAFSGFDDCDLGAICWNVDPATNEGTCVATCTGNAANPICPEETVCMMANDGHVLVCLPPCDPLQTDVCPTDQTCTALDQDPVCIPSVGIEVLPCDMEVCAPDQTCLDSDMLAACPDLACCTAWCDLTAADPDAPCADEPAHSCQPYYEAGAAPTGLEHLGTCRLPA
jgi:hypothetical protein